MRKKIVILAMLVLIPNVLFGDNKIPWVTHIDTGISIAKKYKLPVVVFVYSETCKYCQQSIKNFNQKELKSVLSSGDIVPIAIKKGSRQLSEYSLSMSTYPTYFLLSSSGEMVAAPLNGYVRPGELASYLKKFIEWGKKVQR